MRTIKRNVYFFNELNTKAKAKAIQDYKEIPQNEFYFESKYIIDSWKEKLENIGFTSPNINYSLSYSYFHGDGVSFVSDIDIEQIIDSLIMCNKSTKTESILYNKLITLRKEGIIDLEYQIQRTNNHYFHDFHEKSVMVIDDCIFYPPGSITSHKAENYFTEVFYDLRNKISEYIIELSTQIYFNLREAYDYSISDQAIKYELNESEIEFYHDGSVYQ